MVQSWSDEFVTRVREWCGKVAGLGVDSLVDARLVGREDSTRATGIVAKELFVRLCVHDFPPVPGPSEDGAHGA